MTDDAGMNKTTVVVIVSGIFVVLSTLVDCRMDLERGERHRVELREAEGLLEACQSRSRVQQSVDELRRLVDEVRVQQSTRDRERHQRDEDLLCAAVYPMVTFPRGYHPQASWGDYRCGSRRRP